MSTVATIPDQTVNTNPVPQAAPAKTRKKSALSDQQKQASSLRRDAAMLERLAPTTLEPEVLKEKAKTLRAQADKLAPAAVKAEPRPQCAFVNGEGKQCGGKAMKGETLCSSHTDPLTKLTAEEWDAVTNHFFGADDTQQFQRRLLDGFSWRQLKEIANPIGQAAA